MSPLRWLSVCCFVVCGWCAGDSFHQQAQAHLEALHKTLDLLETLHQELETLRGRADGEKIILFHDAFAYFADMTGMEISYVIDMDENTSLSAREVSEIVDLVKQENIDLLFTEEQYGTKLADAVSRETDARVYVLDSLVSGNYDADSYITGMEKNLETLQQAFQEIETGKEESK